MKRFFKIIKLGVIAVLSIGVVLTIFTTAFLNMSPAFGDNPAKAQQKIFGSLSNYVDGKFKNQIPTPMGLSFRETITVLHELLFRKTPGKNPGGPLPMEKLDSTVIADRATEIERLTWFGHSAVFLEINGSKILLDPMLGQHAGPLPLVSPKRYNDALPITIEQLPFIDAVIISHDHYDHLDYGSIKHLKDKVGRFYVPLGVGSHLRSWGVKAEIITELNWWEEARHDGFTFICAPARHFSGRGFTSNKTLWSSWIIKSARHQLYFSGDSGYGPHFREIGEKFGPMDFVMMECGQYNERWAGIHMTPEETVQATLDVRGKLLMPIHWGAFTLALHSWTDPVNRVTSEAKKVNLQVATPKIGEPVILDLSDIPHSRWWQSEP